MLWRRKNNNKEANACHFHHPITVAISGFFLIGLVVASGLYEISRQHEKVRKLNFTQSLAGWFPAEEGRIAAAKHAAQYAALIDALRTAPYGFGLRSPSYVLQYEFSNLCRQLFRGSMHSLCQPARLPYAVPPHHTHNEYHVRKLEYAARAA
ncbi:MAG: DUF2189 domain-containing protein [Burkholderiaceae bacterium]